MSFLNAPLKSPLKARYFLPAALLVALSVPLLAQMGELHGYVTGPDGKPVLGAVVGFDKVDSKQHFETKSDKKGYFSIYILPYGQYVETVVVDGVLRYRDYNLHVSPGKQNNIQGNMGLDQDLKLKPAAQAAAAMAKEDGQDAAPADKDAAEKKAKATEAAEQARKTLMDSYGAGKAALANQQYDEAIDSLTKASVADAKQGPVWSAMADAYLGRSIKPGADKAGDQAKAAEAFQKAVELKPTDAGNYNNYALSLAAADRFDDAKTNLAKAIELDAPGAGKYYFNLGALLLNKGQNDAAVEQFKKAIEADPNYADSYYQLGMAYAGKSTMDPSGKMIAPPGTVEALQKYLALAPAGGHVQEAKDMLTALNTTVQLNYKDPNAKPAPAANTTKKGGK